MRSHMAPSKLLWKLSTCAPSSSPRACNAWSMSARVAVPYWRGSRLPNMLWLMPCSISTLATIDLLQGNRQLIDHRTCVGPHPAPPGKRLGGLLHQHADA